MLPVIILVRPQMGENIGAAARVMANFGFTELRLVSPRDGWPQAPAISMAAGASHITDKVTLFDSLAEALHDIHVSYAATARPREMVKEVVTPRQMSARVVMGEGNAKTRVALIFGPERSGLTNDDLTYTDTIVTIPVNPGFSSLNLAQSVAVLCYEWAMGARESIGENAEGAAQQVMLPPSVEPENMPANGEEIHHLFQHLEAELDKAGFFKVPEKRSGMIINIRGIFSRISQLSSQDVRTLRGIIRSLANNG